MALIVLASAKGSPGVSTAALALTLTRGVRTILAECDPSGGSVLAGYLQGRIGSGRGLLPWALTEMRRTPPPGGGPVPAEFFGQLADLDPPHRQRLLLPGLTDPAQSNTLGPLWNRFAGLFRQLEHHSPSYDVIADCGRLVAPNLPLPLLWAADVLVLVIRPSLASIAAAMPTLDLLKKQLHERTADTSTLGLLVVGKGRYSETEIIDQLRVPVVARLPHDPRAADVLTDGGDIRLKWPLIQAAVDADDAIRSAVIAHRHRIPPRALRREPTDV